MRGKALTCLKPGYSLQTTTHIQLHSTDNTSSNYSPSDHANRRKLPLRRTTNINDLLFAIWVHSRDRSHCNRIVTGGFLAPRESFRPCFQPWPPRFQGIPQATTYLIGPPVYEKLDIMELNNVCLCRVAYGHVRVEIVEIYEPVYCESAWMLDRCERRGTDRQSPCGWKIASSDHSYNYKSPCCEASSISRSDKGFDRRPDHAHPPWRPVPNCRHN